MIVRRHPLSLALLVAVLTLTTDTPRLDAADNVTPGSSPVAAQTEREQDELLQLVDHAIDITSRRYLTGEVHTPWQIMHGLLALRRDFRIKVGNEKVNALQWLTEGQMHDGLPIVEHSPYGGRFHPFTVPYAFEGHPNQFLAILTMSDLPADFEFTTNVNGTVTIEDMLKNAQMEVNDREEITWTLWSLCRYLPVDSQWTNKYGEPWSIERLVQIQTYASPNDAACGGTHGLFALSLARNAALATGQPLRGIWFEADQKVRNYVAQARSLQNSDGSLSSKYFAGPGYSQDFGKRLATSGHVLEFLMVGARDKDLQQEWLRNAVRAVAQDLVTHRRTAADCGPLYHALHALVLYRQRRGAAPESTQPSTPPETLAEATPEVVAPRIPRTSPADNADDPTAATSEEPANEPVDITEPDPVFVVTVEPTIVEDTEDGVSEETPGDADREAPQGEVSTSIPKPADSTDSTDGIRGLFDPVESDDSAKTDGAVEATEEVTPPKEVVTEEPVVEEPVEVARSPEDNAPTFQKGPEVMEDGYVVPMPPTMD